MRTTRSEDVFGAAHHAQIEDRSEYREHVHTEPRREQVVARNFARPRVPPDALLGALALEGDAELEMQVPDEDEVDDAVA